MVPRARLATVAPAPVARALARFFLLLAFALPAYAGSVNLVWDPVSSPLVAGYAIHYGPAAGSYTASVDVGNVTTATVPGLTEGATYHFAVAAYDSAHAEGGLSNDVAVVIKYAVPVANFTASTLSGGAPLALNFINGSTGSITSYAWTFGDGTTSTVANPAKVYASPGNYTVALTVTGPGGSNAKTRPNYITVSGTSDATPPTAPASLTATATSSSAISLTWSPATDGVGVTGYRVERCQGVSCTTFAQIATPTGTSYSDSGRAAGTTYRYRVRASDAAGNLGAYSPIASATTPSASDTTPPTAPASLTATATSSSAISLTWSAATDNVGVTGYRVERCLGASCGAFAQIATPAGTSYTDPGLAAGSTYRYRVRATDAAGNLGAYSKAASATTSASLDTTPPTAPASLTATATSSSAISLTWSPATDGVGVTGYRVERCQGVSCTTFAQIATPTGTSYSDSGRAAGTTYRYRVRASDAAGNLGAYSPIASATTPSASDTTPPTAPASLTATATSSSAISLTWSAATDNVGVTGYRVERCLGASCGAFAQIATPAGTSYTDPGLAAGSTYRYRVRATDAAGNLGAYSKAASATTSASLDTTPPTAPASLTATATSSSAISLTWSPATDGVGVTGYRVERCQGVSCTTFAQIATPTGTSYSDSGRAAGTTYRYRVRASDAAGNLSGYSNVATATTGTASPAIAFVQQNYATPQTPQSSVAVVYLNAQTAGNLNVVVVGWNDTTATVASVTDSKGNVYVRAVGPTTFPGKLSQSIYYAKNIVAAAASSSGAPNVVTVRFTVPAVFADIRVAEYSGIDRVNPVDVVAIGSGTGTLGATSFVRTTKANAVILGAGTVTSHHTGSGPGFAKRVITSPNGDIVEDRIVTVAQRYNASAPMTAGDWVMQLVAFRGM